MRTDKDMNVWVIGANGMLGHDVIDLLKNENISYIASDVECDITKKEIIENYVENKHITHMINCAAYTAVDKAEDEPDKAYFLNAIGPKNLAEVANVIGAELVQISTDYVFDGFKQEGYLPDDPINPISVYGKTKAAGEEFVREALNEHYIVRTAWLYGKHGNNFVYTMLRLMNERDEISVVNDQHGSPTHAKDLALFIFTLITKEEPYGTYHYSCEGQTTWFEFAQEIYRLGTEHGLVHSKCTINPVPSSEYPTKADRPEWSVLIKNQYNFQYPRWNESLKEYLLT